MRTLLVRPEVRPRGSNGAANGGVELVTECGTTCCEQGLPWYFAGPARLAPSFGRTSRGTFQILRAFVNPRVARPPEASPEWRVRELRHAPQIRALFPPVWASLSGGAANPPPALTQCRGRGSLPQTRNPAKSRPSQRLPWDIARIRPSWWQVPCGTAQYLRSTPVDLEWRRLEFREPFETLPFRRGSQRGSPAESDQPPRCGSRSSHRVGTGAEGWAESSPRRGRR